MIAWDMHFVCTGLAYLVQVWLLASLAVDSLAISGQVAVAVNLGKGDLNAAREVGAVGRICPGTMQLCGREVHLAGLMY